MSLLVPGDPSFGFGEIPWIHFANIERRCPGRLGSLISINISAAVFKSGIGWYLSDMLFPVESLDLCSSSLSWGGYNLGRYMHEVYASISKPAGFCPVFLVAFGESCSRRSL